MFDEKGTTSFLDSPATQLPPHAFLVVTVTHANGFDWIKDGVVANMPNTPLLGEKTGCLMFRKAVAG